MRGACGTVLHGWGEVDTALCASIVRASDNLNLFSSILSGAGQLSHLKYKTSCPSAMRDLREKLRKLTRKESVPEVSSPNVTSRL